MASYGVWKGINAGITNATNTALNIAQLQGQQAHQRAIEANDMQRLKMQEEQFNMSKKKYEYEDAERQKKEQLDNAFTPASLIAPQIHQLPETKKTYLDAVRQAGFEVKEGEDGEVYLPNKAYSYLNQLQQTNMEFSKGVTDKMLVDLQSKSVAIGQQILQVQENGGDLKKLGPLVQQQNAVKQQIAGIYSVQPKIMEELEKERMKQDAALEKERFLEEGRNRRADAQNATTIKAANVRSSSKGNTQAKNNTRVYVDTVNGARHVVNLNDPSHKKWLAKYGGQLRPEKDYEKDFSGGDETSGDLTYNPKTGKFE